MPNRLPHRNARTEPTPFRRASTRTAVLAVIALGMITAGIAILVTRNQAANPADPADTQTPDGEEIEFLLGGEDEMRGTNLVIQITDQDDPTRLAAEILADRYDPDGPTIRLVEKPKAWLFGEDGSAWLIESDRGRFYIPEGEDQPREGTLTGNVTARRFNPTGPDPVNRPDPMTDTPALVATTDEPLRFNLDILTFETDGLLEIETDTIDFAGRGAYAVLNESRESITTLRVDQGERLVYTPPLPEPEPATESASSGPSPRPPASGNTTTSRSAQDVSPSRREPNTPDPLADPMAQADSADPKAQTATAARDQATGTTTPRSTTDRSEPASRTRNEPPKIDLYRVVFADHVEAEAGPRTISADRLTVWTRLIDNKLPDRTPTATARMPIEAALVAAFAARPLPIESPVLIHQGRARNDQAANQTPAPASDTLLPAPALTPPQKTGSSHDPVVLTWDGPLTVEPLTDSPDQLNRGDDLAMRFEATDGEVEIVDTDADATANALAANYFAQRERVELEGSGGSIVIASDRSGRIEGMNAVEIELAAGVITIPTAGELFGKDHDANTAEPMPQTIAWSEAASFLFAVENGTMTDRLERAGFRGRVRSASEDATVDGETLLALFETPEGESPRLLQLNVEDAIARDGRGAEVGGEGMEVHFASGTYGEELDPTRAILTGDAFARREGKETIRGQWIDATLARDEDADVIVTLAEAKGEVAFDDGAGTLGRGETLIADTLAETATITGPADPERTWVSRDGTRITGPDIRLDSGARTVEVYGPGTFAHDPSDEHAGNEQRTISAAWTGRMAFDDTAGTVLCLGAVKTESPGPGGTLDTVTGDRLEITLAPRSSAQGDDPVPDAGDSRLRFAEVFGTADTPARAESTRFALPADQAQDGPDQIAAQDAEIESLYRLDAAQIRFAAGDDRIQVPTAGRLFILDRSPPDEDEAEPANGPADDEDPLIGGDGSRGSTLITWTGSMDFDRAAGRAVVRDDARIINQPLGKPQPSEVIANTITAAFTQSGNDLRWAIAEGDALLRIENDREILADRLIYDPENRQIRALGENGRRVEITDLARGSTTNARAVIWDLATDRITITNPGAIIAPE